MTGGIEGPVLVTGAAGLLGTWLRRSAPEGADLVPVVHRRKLAGTRAVAADLRDRGAVHAAFAEARPRLVIHAAFARDEASIVDATRHVTEAAGLAGAGLILISSEAVFSGDGFPRCETSEPDPVSVYGAWKARAEALAREIDVNATIVRLPLIASRDPEDHILSAIRTAGRGGAPSVWFTDEMRQPAPADHLAHAIWTIAGLPPGERTGIWHLPGPERLSRFEIAGRAVEAAGLPSSCISGRPSPPDAQRPRDLVLTADRAHRAIGWSPDPIYRSTSASTLGLARCGDCGAVVTEVTCGELFDRLLALDHSRRQPWGALHGEAVACYFLQHPSEPRAPQQPEALLALLEPLLSTGPAVGPGPTVTIHDLAVDGTFPADGHRERLRRWASSIAREARQ